MGTFDISSLTALPFGLPGQVYRSPMPFCNYDPSGTVLAAYRQAGISVVVLLASDEECLQVSRRDLRQEYQEMGYQVIYLPILDFTNPAKSGLNQALEAAIAYLQNGENVVVHCRAGIGRTGVFLACLAVQVFNKSGSEALAWVREFIPDAVESPAQRDFVLNYRKDGG